MTEEIDETGQPSGGDLSDLEERMMKRKSRLREELEALMQGCDVSQARQIAVVNMQTGERHFFDSYSDAQEFMKGKPGRWYLTRPDIRPAYRK